MTVWLKFYIWLFCRKVGKNTAGTCYYEDTKRGRRFVRYKGLAEASKVPQIWHAWLHKTSPKPPSPQIKLPFHEPNLTGTKWAYQYRLTPHILRLKRYTPWKP